MSSRRLKFIAAQAVIVGALLIVVSLTLLRPEDGNPLFDIIAPGGSEVSVGPADSQPGEGKPGEGRGDDRGAGQQDPSVQPPPGDPTPPLGLVPGPPSSAGATPPGTEGDEPTATGDQYNGTVARLTQELQ